MRNVKTKIISLLLIAVTLVSLFSLSSCNRRYDETEVIEATKKLLKEAEMLHIVYYGSGIKYFDDEDEKGGIKMIAEEWITDDNAFNKKGKMKRFEGKFRRKTIDLKEQLIKELTQALNE